MPTPLEPTTTKQPTGYLMIYVSITVTGRQKGSITTHARLETHRHRRERLILTCGFSMGLFQVLRKQNCFVFVFVPLVSFYKITSACVQCCQLWKTLIPHYHTSILAK